MEYQNIHKAVLRGETEVPIRVRYGETDQMGVVHHCNYFRYFEVARIEQFRKWGLSYKSLEDFGIYLMVMDARCTFRAPAFFDDMIIVRTWIEKVTRYRLIHQYEISVEREKIVAKGRTVLGSVSKEGLPSPFPDDFWELLIRLE
jgi:acyl-CoA thioester hydrolase